MNPIPTVNPDMPQFLKPVDPAAASAAADSAIPVAAPVSAPIPVVAPIPPKPFVPPTASVTAPAAPASTAAVQPTPQTAPLPASSSFTVKVSGFLKQPTTKVAAITALVVIFLFLIIYLLLPIPQWKATGEVGAAQAATKAAEAKVDALLVQLDEEKKLTEKARADEKSAAARAGIFSTDKEKVNEEKAALMAANTALVAEVNDAWKYWAELNTASKMAAATKAMKNTVVDDGDRKALTEPAPAPKSSPREQSAPQTGSSLTKANAIDLIKGLTGESNRVAIVSRGTGLVFFKGEHPSTGIRYDVLVREAGKLGMKNFRLNDPALHSELLSRYGGNQ